LRINLNLTQAEISDRLGFSRTTWTNYEGEVSTPSISDLIAMSKFFHINETDLLHKNLKTEGKNDDQNSNIKKHQNSKVDGKNEGKNDVENTENSHFLAVVNDPAQPYKVKAKMPLVVTVDTQGNENVLFVPNRARAGYLTGYGDAEFISKLPAYRLPGLTNGTYRMFEVEGLSMHPTLNSGDIIIGSFVEQWRLLRDDRVHVIVTKNEGVLVKRILNRLDKDGKFILKSDNYKERDQYPNLVVSPDDIHEIWYAFGFISRNMRPPAEMYNRLIDLEGRLSIIEEKVKNKP
jgi:transcriptional regulator with XRE-family HTH domain